VLTAALLKFVRALYVYSGSLGHPGGVSPVIVAQASCSLKAPSVYLRCAALHTAACRLSCRGSLGASGSKWSLCMSCTPWPGGAENRSVNFFCASHLLQLSGMLQLVDLEREESGRVTYGMVPHPDIARFLSPPDRGWPDTSLLALLKLVAAGVMMQQDDQTSEMVADLMLGIALRLDQPQAAVGYRRELERLGGVCPVSPRASKLLACIWMHVSSPGSVFVCHASLLPLASPPPCHLCAWPPIHA
jgi:hypothetical protein